MPLKDNSLPAITGVSLKSTHYQTILDHSPSIGWFELHPENYMGDGGPPHKYLSEIRKNYPLSMHGVGMSLGSDDGIDLEHLHALAKLVERYQPEQVSEHLAWSHFNKVFMNDLLPLPFNEESLKVVSANIDLVQNTLGRTILVENPSTYLEFNNNTFSEPEFLIELTRRTGCGLLLDVNNVFVSACNQGFDPVAYISQIPKDSVGEIHLSGHAIQEIDGVEVRIDDHGSAVKDDVWQLHEITLKHLGKRVPMLVEWDTDIPEFHVLMSDAIKADAIADKINHVERDEVVA